MDFLTNLFDTSSYPARWFCGNGWQEHPEIGWLHIFSDLGVFSAYFAIPCILLYFRQKRTDLPFRSIFLLFGSFIMFCGWTHLNEAIIFWWPIYPFAGFIKLLTALVSWATVIALIRIVPQAMAMRSPQELEREIIARKNAEISLHQANSELERRVAERTAELTQANQTLNREREWFRTTLHSIGDGVIATDGSGRIQLLNSIAEALTGWKEADAKGKSLNDVFNIVHEETREVVVNPAIVALREGRIVTLANHTVLVAKSGEERPISDSAAPIRDENGTVSGAVLVFRDEGDRRKQVEQLRESEQRLNFALAASDLGQWELNLGNKVVHRTLRHDQIFGYDKLQPQWTYDIFMEHVVPEDRAGVDEKFKQSIASGGVWDFECRIKRKDGDIRWIGSRARLFWDSQGKLRRMLGTIADIHERRQRDEALRLNRERLDMVVGSSGVGLWYCDLPLADLNFNPRCKEHFEMPLDAEINIEQFYEKLHPEDRDRTRRTVEKAITIGGTYDTEYRVLKSDGGVRWIRAQGKTFRNAAGVPVRFDGITIDISERKQQEEELRDADRRKDQFLATLAHELRNPLAPLRSGLAIVRADSGLKAESVRASEMMGRQLNGLVRLVDDLLDVSRISRGKIELRREVVDVHGVIQNAVEACEPFVATTGQTLIVDVPPEPIHVDVDPVRLSQVLQNLLNNSAKYSDRGSEIRVGVARNNGHVVLSVKDNGLGIAPQQFPRLFSMFEQGEHGRKTQHAGLGIGLSLVKSLVDMHGGKVEAFSAGAGKGSEFRVTLQTAAPRTPPSVQPVAKVKTETQSGPRRVLIIDDNSDAAETLAILLEMNGHTVQMAHSAEEALNVGSTFKPDVVLSDIGLPDMDGYELAGKIRITPWGCRALLCAVTGWGREEDRQKSRQAGFDRHLVKPVDPDVLFETMGG